MKRYHLLFIPAALLVLFVLFTVIVKTVDTQYLANNTYIGLYTMNHAVNNWIISFGKFDSMKLFSDIVLYATFTFPLGYAIFFVVEWIRLKSLKLIDRRVYILFGTYVLMAALYFFFEIVKINYAPIVNADGSVKASYPSSHVFIATIIVICSTLASIDLLQINKVVLRAATVVLMVFLVLISGVLRLLSGQHWLSDIIASYLLSAVVVSLFAIIYVDNRPEKEIIE